MMSYPSNFDHPQPLRMWSNPNESRGFYASFSPTRNKDWLLKPGNSYVLRYRFVVYNGHFNSDIAKSAYQNYSILPKIVIKKSALTD